jgi:hypothetical protein
MKRGKECGDGSLTVSYGIRCQLDQLIRNNFSFQGREAPSSSLTGSTEGARVLILVPYGVIWATIASLNFAVPSTQGAIISPIRLRNRCKLASELDVSVKFGFVRIQRLSPEERYFRWIPLASRQQAISSGAPRKNHTWETRHLAESTRDVGSAGRRESFATGASKCGFPGHGILTR